MSEREYEVVVAGGGPAGLSAALYTTRLGHDTAVVDRGGGRAAMMLDTHNVVGVPESVSGVEFLETAVEQVESYGADYRRGLVTGVEPLDGPEPRFRVETDDGALVADRVVLATGFSDARPDSPLPRTGKGLHYCLHCDAYMFVDEPVYVMGHGESAAHVAMILLNFTDDVDLLLRGDEPIWSAETDRQLRAHPVDVVETDIVGVENGPDGWLEGFTFEDGTFETYRGGFAMYGADYESGLAADLGCAIEDGAVAVDDHGHTTVEGVYAVGDLTPGHNQVPVAMAEGAQAGIAIHKALRPFPMPVEELDGVEAPAVSERLRERARDRRAASDD
jgi:thioredoxin reductase (NADPH)